MSVAYLIIAHDDPSQLLRLVRALRRDTERPIVVHIDRRARSHMGEVSAVLGGLSNVAVISAVRVSWGHFSLVEAMLAGLGEVLRRFPQACHIKHLSGHDYPIRGLADFEAFVDGYDRCSLIDHHPLPQPGRECQLEHVAYRHFTRLRRNWLRWPLPRTIRPGEYHVGSAFWCLAREHAEYLLALPPTAWQPFRPMLASDEIAFQSLLVHAPCRRDLVSVDLTWSPWRAGAPGPETIVDDLPEMSASNCWFGRKFSSDASAIVLDRIDAQNCAGEPRA